jgi:isoleucyl-tRNA synthetase
VNDAGCFTSEAGEDLEGLSVLGDGNTAVIAKLKETGTVR